MRAYQGWYSLSITFLARFLLDYLAENGKRLTFV